MFASVATLLAITVDRYLYIIKPMRYPQIVTHRRVFLAASGIWTTLFGLLALLHIYFKSFGIGFRSLCEIPHSIYCFSYAFIVYLPLILAFWLNYQIFSVARKQRKRILAKTTIASVDNSTEESANMQVSFVPRFFVALKAAKTFAISQN